MKILFTFLTFGKDIFAGMENSLYSLCQGMLKAGSIPLVYTTSHSGDDSEVDRIKVYRSKVLKVSHFGDDLSQEQEIIKNKHIIISELEWIIEKENPDCVVAWDPLWGIITLLGYKFDRDCFLVHHVIQNPRMIRSVNNYNFKRQFAVSNSLKKDLIEAGVKGEIETLPNSIDISMYKTLHKKKNKAIENIICNGRLSPEKGVKYCVEAFERYLRNVNPMAKLFLFSGSFPFGDVNQGKSEILDIIKTLGIESNVVLLPNLKWSEIPQIIANADVSVLPSLRETFGISVLESMAAKTPVICTDVGNLPELIQGNGVLVKPKNSEEIYSALVKLNNEEKLYRDYQNGGFKRAQIYDSLKIAKLFIEAIEG